MKCKQCNKPIKEDTDGNLKYCQGHDIFNTYYIERQIEQQLDEDLEASNLNYGIPDDTFEPLDDLKG